MVERIKQQFDTVNVSRSGSISPEEFGLFLDATLETEVRQKILHCSALTQRVVS